MIGAYAWEAGVPDPPTSAGRVALDHLPGIRHGLSVALALVLAAGILKAIDAWLGASSSAHPKTLTQAPAPALNAMPAPPSLVPASSSADQSDTGRAAPKRADKRGVVTQTFADLWAMREGHTKLEALRVLDPFLGKWMRVTGVVSDVAPRYVKIGDHSVVLLFFDQKKWSGRLAVLQRGQTITALGQITEYSLDQKDHWSLSNCDLLEVKR